jgi:hypothetical protein
MDVLFGSVYEEMKKSGKNETMTKDFDVFLTVHLSILYLCN